MNKRYLLLFGILFLMLFVVPNDSNYDQVSDLKFKPLLSSSEDDYYFDWNITWGTTYDDSGEEVATDTFNNVYIIGSSDTTGSDNCDIKIIKYNPSGVEQWSRNWGGINDDKALDILIDSSNNIFIVGYTKSLGDTDGDIIIIKYDILGNEIWNKTWGGNLFDFATCIMKDSSDNFYVVGRTNSFGDTTGDALLIKFNQNFEEQWNETWGGNEPDIANKVEKSSDGYLYVVGHSDSVDSHAGYSDVFLLKYDENGNYQWERTWGTSYDQRGKGLALDSNDNIYITGYSFGHPTSSGKGFLLKYNSFGTFQWEKIWGFNGVYGNYFYRIIIDDEDDLYISGCTTSYGIPDNHDALLLNYDTSGNQNWFKYWAGIGFDVSIGICMDSNGNIYLAGHTDSYSAGGKDFLLLKYKYNIDLIAPNITINEPFANQIFGSYPPNYKIEIIEEHLDSIWYRLKNGTHTTINKTIYNQFGSIDKDIWNCMGNGTITIEFFANDTSGNLGNAEVIVHKDIYTPLIELYYPIPDQTCGPLALQYNFSVSTVALDTMWYKINNGPNNIILSTVGSIEQSVWDEYGEGIINIKFYANNTYGKVNFKEVNVTKLSEIIERNAYALIIGISDYPGSDNDLSYCDDDALAVRNMLINDYNFKPENIIYLEDSSATKNAINNSFNQIESLINPDDIFYFYYSGHGGANLVSSGPSTYYINSPHPYPNYYDHTWWISSTDAAYIRVHFSRFDLESGYDYLFIGDTYITIDYYYQYLTGSGTNFWSEWIPVLNDNRIYLRLITDYSVRDWGFQIDQIEVMQYSNPHYLCSYDSIPSNQSNYYLDSLLDLKLDSLNCDQKYVIIDACNSGGMIPEAQDVNYFIMTACTGGQFCIEEPELNHGIFTYSLLNSLNQANDQNDDDVISMEECFSHISTFTKSYSSNYGPGIQYHPQLFDGIDGEAVLYPSIGSISITPVDNQLFYSFYMYGHGFLKTLNITMCSISPTITFKTEEVKNRIISPTGFGYYWGFIELEEGYIAGGIQILAEVEGYRSITINLTIGDSDGDGLTDLFEILEGEGLDPSLNDTDFDGLSDYEEYYGPTDPLNNDTDSDGLLDGEEANIYQTNPLINDTDSDGLLDGEEVNNYNTDPLQEDSDSDGLLDGEEVINYNTDPLQEDSDSDGLLDGEEVNNYNTDPLSSDTDSDTMPDKWEVDNLLNPLVNDTGLDPDEDLLINILEYQSNTDPQNPDTDLDGLLDGEEVNTYNTDPLSGDTDADNMPDKWEVDNLLNPLLNDTALDPDNDLLINILEYQHSTDPQNPDTDGDEWTDGDEVLIYDTDPLDPDDHPSPRAPPAISGYIFDLILLNMVVIATIYIIKSKRRLFKY